SALDRHWEAHPLAVAATRLLALTGARLSEILHLRRDAIEDVGDEGASVRLGDSKSGPLTI
ncbi:MAG: integrase, partial [Gemmatimonadota bacterium]|nr:integrase [Gemmatimonadota bacterium]